MLFGQVFSDSLRDSFASRQAIPDHSIVVVEAGDFTIGGKGAEGFPTIGCGEGNEFFGEGNSFFLHEHPGAQGPGGVVFVGDV
jgi:hypothetical protein